MRESVICRALGHAELRIDDVPGGVLISIHPSALATLRNVRLGSDALARAFSPEHGFVPASTSEDSCAVGDLRRHVTTALVEQTNAGARVRLVSSAGAGEAQALRDAARRVVDELD